MTALRNLITDVAGVRIGNAQDPKLASGVTVALFDEPAVTSYAVNGGAPGTRDTDLLEPDKVVPGINAVVLSGGSAFGLDAASGVQAYLREKGVGFAVGTAIIPLVPQGFVDSTRIILCGGDERNVSCFPTAPGHRSGLRPRRLRAPCTSLYKSRSVGAG